MTQKHVKKNHQGRLAEITVSLQFPLMDKRCRQGKFEPLMNASHTHLNLTGEETKAQRG